MDKSIAKTKAAIFSHVIVNGTHSWPQAPDDKDFLRPPHPHRFHITVIMGVTDMDRELEFFDLEGLINAWIAANFHNYPILGYDFGTRSCEQIATEMLEAFGAETVTVTEDDRAGAIVSRVQK